MKRYSPLMSLLLVCCVFGAATEKAHGQGKKPPKGKTTVVDATVNGTVVGIQGDTIVVMNSRNEKWIVQVNTPMFRIKAKVTVEGNAVVEALRAGVYVRFTANVDKRGNIQGEVNELEIFVPSESAKPGMYANDGALNLDGDAKPGVSNYLIAGQIASYRRGKLTLAIPGSKGVRGKVSENAKVTIRGEDYRMAKPGDKISAKGFHLPDQKGTLMAREITITLAGVLGETAKSKKKKDRLAQRDDGKQPDKRQEFGDLLKDGDSEKAEEPKDGEKPGKPPIGFNDKAGPQADQPAKDDDDDGPLILIIN
jgi:hypothetical protein